MPTAIPRPDWTPGGSFADFMAWVQRRVDEDPAHRLPPGFEGIFRVNSQGRVEQDLSFLQKHPWIPAVAGMAAGGGLAAAGMGGAAAAGAGAGGAAGIPTAGSLATGLGPAATSVGLEIPATAGTLTGAGAAGAAGAARTAAGAGGLGMGTKTLVGLGALSAGSNLFQAHMASSAANDAAKIQAASADKALALQEKMWQTQQQQMAPWVTQGQKAVTALGSLMGLGGVVTPTAPTAPENTATPTGNPTGSSPASRVGMRPRPIGSPITGPGSPNIPLSTAMTARQSGYVTMRAPDGSVEDVPMQYREHYLAQGATLV